MQTTCGTVSAVDFFSENVFSFLIRATQTGHFFSNWLIMMWIQILNRQLSCYLVDLVNDKWISVLVFGYARSSGSYGVDKLFGLSKFVECGELSNMGHASWSFGRSNTISDSKFRFESKNLTFDMGKAEHGFGNEFKHDFQPKLVRICCLII